MSHAGQAAAFTRDLDRTHWHDQALWHFREKRDLSMHDIPEWEELRQAAADIKGHLISRLDHYLELFEERATRNGIRVHWADTAEEHNEIVHGILAAHGVKKAVKSKSMLTEECHLNPYLEQRGIEIIDTDLGERIVQMRGEPPSHIVAPAIHLKKEEIGELFHERLGTEKGCSDPTELTCAARLHLREKFLGAEAGITGVNFAVAETGGVVVCTNEGNADLGTALPPVHIASMGIEKLVPDLEHLAVFIRLLARAATGMPITIYTSHFHAPRPGCERHVVIVNNGRTDTLGMEEFRRSLGCIRCGACLNTCPVYRRSGGYSYESIIPGPIGSILHPSRDPEKYADLPFASSLCGSCTDVCPVKIDLHHQLLAWRKRLVELNLVSRKKRKQMKKAGAILSDPAAYEKAGRRARWLRLVPRFLIYGPWNTWGKQRELPEIPRESFRDWYRKRGKS